MSVVVVIEPNHLLRLGIVHLLSKMSSVLTLAGYTHSKIIPGTDVQPCDLAILSTAKEDNIAELVKNLKQAHAPNAILLLHESSDVPQSIHSMSALIAGCIYKYAEPEVLQASVQLVLAGGCCFPNSCSSHPGQTQLLALDEHERQLHTKYNFSIGPLHADEPLPFTHVATNPVITSADKAQITPSSLPLPYMAMEVPQPAHHEAQMLGLTPRQYEVLVLLAKGYPIKTVGRQLNISVATAKAHTESLYQRLDVRNRNAAVYAAIAKGATLGWSCIPNQHQVGSPPP